MELLSKNVGFEVDSSVTSTTTDNKIAIYCMGANICSVLSNFSHTELLDYIYNDDPADVIDYATKKIKEEHINVNQED